MSLRKKIQMQNAAKVDASDEEVATQEDLVPAPDINDEDKVDLTENDIVDLTEASTELNQPEHTDDEPGTQGTDEESNPGGVNDVVNDSLNEAESLVSSDDETEGGKAAEGIEAEKQDGGRASVRGYGSNSIGDNLLNNNNADD